MAGRTLSPTTMSNGALVTNSLVPEPHYRVVQIFGQPHFQRRGESKPEKTDHLQKAIKKKTETKKTQQRTQKKKSKKKEEEEERER
ncbi:Uncharacterized protein TCM_030089 [Theobroma cacao]|uniref:Uncharacterized protein n=1 Tax=Theobroma cacao TaxID=3641 RepID=A0A061GHB2_THECC|nr:Uncharacterized protein TCM_030089 [Theobroma cacao]